MQGRQLFKAALLCVIFVLAGCGSGGYPGNTLQSVSASQITIDAGQSFSVSANGSGSLPLGWVLTGTCSSAGCGTLSTATGTSTTYTAPSPLTAPMQVTLVANITGARSTKTVAITVNPAPVINGATPNGTVGVAYSATLVTSGGTGAVKLSQASGTLPAGLSFNAATGVISGTPTQPGTSSVTFQAVDSSDVPYTVTAARTITVGTAAVALTASGAPPAGVVGTPYRTALQASGGTAPYTWTVVSGSLPAGLTLSAAGVISGTPILTGTSTFTAQVQDAAGARATVASSIGITSAQTPVIVATGTLPPGTVGTPYTGTVGGSGGTGPYTCTVAAGSLPAGLTLGANCVVSGTPTTPGTTMVTVGVTDSGNPPGSGSGPVTITINPAALAITAGTLPNGTVGVPYASAVGVTGGSAPYTCSVVNGALPAGLSFTSGCNVTGTPTVAGTSTPTVRATDSSNPAASTTRQVSVTIAANPTTLTVSSPPAGTVNQPYTGTVPVTGGTGPYTCVLTGGSLPAGLTLNANCQITGTPTTTGSTTATITATDSSNPPNTGSGTVTVTINPGTTTLSLGVPPTATVNVPYTGTVPVSGGTGPYTCTQTGGTLPAGLSLNGNCQITGTPTTPGTTTVTVTATDSSNPTNTGSSNVPVTVNPATAVLTLGTPAPGTVNTPYVSTVPVSGGTSPYTCQQVGGALPAGLTLNSNCGITGTPTTAGTTNVTVKATDAANPANTHTGNVPVTINNAGAATLTVGTPANATVNVPYTGTIPVSGGTAPYTCQQTGGTLPAGLVLGNTCQVTGTPTTPGTTTVVVTATDGANPANTTTANVPITVNPATVMLTFGNPPAATVNTPYTGTVPVSGGTAPYTCMLAGGTLPAGLTLGANCQITGTPFAPGSATVSVSATDSGSPATTNTGSVTVTVNPAPLTLTISSPPAAIVNTPYTGTIPVTGGAAPYTCQQTGGTLPAGLTLNSNCQITGTPTTPGTTSVTVKATDSTSPANTNTATVPVTVNPAGATLTLGNPPSATVNVPYTGTIPVNGGSAPYTCQQTGGTLPAGLTLNSNCQITGTPTVPGATSVTVKATDSTNPANTTTGAVPVIVNPAGALLTLGNPPAATVNTPYAGTVPVTGGTAPYTCVLAGGTLPAGLSLGSNCQITGTPTVAGSATVSVTATGSGSPATTSTGNVIVTVNPAAVTLTIGNPPTATVGTPYTGTVPVTGGTGPYTCTTSSTLPAGLSLGSNCQITGTPTASGPVTIVVTATDSANHTSTGPSTITVQPAPALTFTGSLPNGVQNQPYAQTLAATGGVGPYTYTLTAGALPAGLTLYPGGVVSGTPTAVGASSFTVTATDSEGTPQTASLPLVLLITYPTTPSDALLKGPYAFLFQGYDDVVAGVLAYQTATIGSFTADGLGVLSAGEQDSNHQSGNIASGNTVPTRTSVGTYTVGTDGRGFITTTTFNANGTVNETVTYAVALKLPTAPATAASRGSLIRYDGNQLAGTKGSGTLLQQTPAALTAGLNGSYAYGVQGDTPCLPACTVGLAAGPVAGVGQFKAAGGTLTGTADTNVAAANFANSNLSGTTAAADGNGRVQLTLNTSALAGTFYPTDYAAYIVDSNNVLLMSTDKHSAFILQAGTARLQTQATFSNASLGVPFVGYENSPVNPGLVGQTLQNVLNLSTATVFRGTGNGAGTCTTRPVDVGGTTGVVNTLTGLGTIIPIGTVTTLLGAFAATGDSTCAVAGNGRATYNYPQLTTTVLGIPVPVPGSTPPPPRTVYLVSPGTGYFLETGYAGLGMIEAQTGNPFTPATLNGTFVYGTIPQSTLATTNASGTFTADGQGHVTRTRDENVGVGTLNVLQLGITTPDTYTLTDATAGRFQLAAGPVIYAISPGRFVLLETDALSTTPYIALLY